MKILSHADWYRRRTSFLPRLTDTTSMNKSGTHFSRNAAWTAIA
jgi:hypothetical protein